MPTPIDQAMNSRVRSIHSKRHPDLTAATNTSLQNLFFGFAGFITAAAAWSIWGQDLFPQLQDPKGNPEKWTDEEMRFWLNNVHTPSPSCPFFG
jgi:hypothetical protein